MLTHYLLLGVLGQTPPAEPSPGIPVATSVASDYVALITSQHASKPRFSAMVSAVAQCFVDQQAFLAAMPNAFDLDFAQGVQLDATGLWIGLTRVIKVPVANVYFSLDTAGVGADQGVWFQPGDSTSAASILDDGTYRIMLRAKVGSNKWNGSMQGTVAILNAVFVPEGWRATLRDNQDMTMTVTISGAPLPPLLAAMVSGGYIPIRPVGVSATYVLP